MKNKWNLTTNLFSVLLIGFIIYKQAPAILNNIEKEGTALKIREYTDIRTNKKISFPANDNKTRSLAIFWATWCGPCKVEMKRLHQSVIDGKIDKDRIYAINAFESKNIVKRFIAKNPYKFKFINSPEITNRLQVKSTPTTILVEGQSVTSMSSGLSFIGIWRAEQYLNQ